jgi:hypothetical protein
MRDADDDAAGCLVGEVDEQRGQVAAVAGGDALLGSVPAMVARNAHCDVLIVQTTDLGSAAGATPTAPVDTT